MSMPFYASPEQLVRDRSEYARKGIARGRSVVVCTYTDGILFVAENPSSALHKVSEIYDRIGFAAVGKYNEFENLRVAGVRYADMRGYAYDRRDVTGRGLANAFAQTLGSIFIENNKPYEIEVVVAEVGEAASSDQIYRLTYDGTVGDEDGFVAIGGQADAVSASLKEAHTAGQSLSDALASAVAGLRAGATAGNGEARPLTDDTLEVAVLDRTRPGRKFRRISGPALVALLPQTP
ncbi:MAG TPA: proteasome subunit alpha [Mycobacteriales bacterium]|jgi:proteasome alpha subunit|nr:proteasome subunit alpha [Mycobacteriales bacterium]